jgi:3-oxoadipate enol-lactonase
VGTRDGLGLTLAHEESGSGAPLLLIHAGVADRRMWDPQWEAFSTSFRVVRCDLPGFGDTPEMPGGVLWHRLVAELLESLEISRCHLVGASIGSRVALELALAKPRLVDRLVLAPPPLLRPPSKVIIDFGEAEDAALEAGDLEAATELNLRTWVDGAGQGPGRVDPALRAKVAEMQLLAFQHASGEGWPTWPEPPAAERLDQLAASTLVIVGDLDQPDVLEAADLLVAVVADCRKLVIEGTAHVMSMEQPEAFNASVIAFLCD